VPKVSSFLPRGSRAQMYHVHRPSRGVPPPADADEGPTPRSFDGPSKGAHAPHPPPTPQNVYDAKPPLSMKFHLEGLMPEGAWTIGGQEGQNVLDGWRKLTAEEKIRLLTVDRCVRARP
jgi:hypothetical protein